MPAGMDEERRDSMVMLDPPELVGHKDLSAFEDLFQSYVRRAHRRRDLVVPWCQDTSCAVEYSRTRCSMHSVIVMGLDRVPQDRTKPVRNQLRS